MHWKTPSGETRTEHDLVGDFAVPAEAYYGVHTARALENFPITGRKVGDFPYLVKALAYVKWAAALANYELGILPKQVADAIVAACERVATGEFNDQFVVDPIQGGAGTSTNMNANEVIANVALEILGRPKGDYTLVHPLQHVNMSQSTNDVYPTASRLAIWRATADLMEAITELARAFRERSKEFAGVLKMGRTQMQDAVPMTVGQEFEAFAVTIEEDVVRLAEARTLLLEVNLGGTAIGTGINTPAGYGQLVVQHLRDISDEPVIRAFNSIEATPDAGALVQCHGVLKRVAVKVSKICNDLRLLSSGPRAGLGEINLPAVQAGSSIMPGKVNPVIPEVVNQIAFEVIGHDSTVAIAAESGQLQLNAFEPIMFKSLFDSTVHLTGGLQVLTSRCVSGITVNVKSLEQQVHTSIGLATALCPILGYETATKIALEAASTGASVIDLVVAKELLTRAEVNKLLTPETLANPHPGA